MRKRKVIGPTEKVTLKDILSGAILLPPENPTEDHQKEQENVVIAPEESLQDYYNKLPAPQRDTIFTIGPGYHKEELVQPEQRPIKRFKKEFKKPPKKFKKPWSKGK